MNKLLNLSDLITLEGLTKAGEGEPTMELGGKEEKQLKEVMTDLAVKMENNKDIKTGDLASLVDTMKKTLARELSPENTVKILATLKTRFEKQDKFYKSAKGVNWEDVQTKLEANPEKLWSLNEMERTGGEPDVLSYDKESSEYLFIDCSEDSPKDRRNCVYDREGEVGHKQIYPTETCISNAVSMAALMGVNLLNKEEYEELQTRGEFDKYTWSWIKTPIDKRKAGKALYGRASIEGVSVLETKAHCRGVLGAWRGVLRVK